MSWFSKVFRRNYPGMKSGWDKLRESESGIAGITGTLGAIWAPLAVLGQYFKKETEPGSGVYEPDLINPATITIAGVAGLLVYIIIKKKK